MAAPVDPVVETLVLLEERGGAAYVGEPVTQLQHALQCAALAERYGAPPSLVAAALLHDVGHLLDADAAAALDAGDDAHHEDLGAAWLSERFGPEVGEPVRLHVAAKRYLCATDEAYATRLSAASTRTLALQGGPMSAEERHAFQAEPHHAEAVQLRRWDDAGKVHDLEVPPLEHHRALLTSLAG